MLTAEDIMTVCVADRKRNGIPVDRIPDAVPFMTCGVSFHLRPMTAADLAKLLRFDDGSRTPIELGAAVFALSACDAGGRLLYDIEDVPSILADIPARAIAEVTTRAREINTV
ncbi:MAG: hypothetical protein U0792_07915 [Gemmataceae bacterium]